MGAGQSKIYTYLALGDSYTIGESVTSSESFPFQLRAQLNKAGVCLAEPKIIAKTGWTSHELQKAIIHKHLKESFDLVTLLIGVNNQYRGYPKESYRKEFKALLETALVFASNRAEHVFVISIPDWGGTPFARENNQNPQTVAEAINGFNEINRYETELMGICYIDITGSSRDATTDLSLIASDGLHPSAKMYREWADRLVNAIMDEKNNSRFFRNAT